MTLNQLRYFCTASRCHSITKAAEELYVTQPTISMAIRDLEIEFGISLFSRKGNQLSLTQEGESFYKKATYILQYCNELQADYSSMSRVKPPLRIGIPPMLSTVFFPELLIGTLLFLKLLKFPPEFVCCLCWLFQEGSISIIWCIVHTDEITNVDLLFPTIAFESVPLLEINFCQFVTHPFQLSQYFVHCPRS